MTAADTLAKLKAHLAKEGFADIEVNMTGGDNPTQTELESKLIQTQLSIYRKLGLDPNYGLVSQAHGLAMSSPTRP